MADETTSGDFQLETGLKPRFFRSVLGWPAEQSAAGGDFFFTVLDKLMHGCPFAPCNMLAEAAKSLHDDSITYHGIWYVPTRHLQYSNSSLLSWP